MDATERRPNRPSRGRQALGLALGLSLGLCLGLAATSLRSVWGGGSVGIEEAPPRLASALSDADPVSRAARVAGLLARIPSGADGPAAIASVRDAFLESSIFDGEPEYALLAAWWAQRDPRSAHRWIREDPRGASIRVLAAVLDEWGARDPGAAVRAATEEGFALRRRRALEAAMGGAARNEALDAESLGDALAAIPDRSDRRRAMKAFGIRRLEQESLESLLAWTEAAGSDGVSPAEARPDAAAPDHRPDPSLREDGISGIAMAVALEHPERAARLLSTRLSPDRPLAEGVASHVAERWAERDPKAALEWLSTLAPDALLAEAVRTTYRAWLLSDRAAALGWAEERVGLEEEWFEPIRANYAFILGAREPERGLDLLFDLPIDQERALYVQHLFVRWRARQPEAAHRWLDAASLPESRKQELRRLPPPPRLAGGAASDSPEGSSTESERTQRTESEVER